MSKLSIVIPVFNEAKFISTTLNSVVKASTPNMKKEIVIIDDGSTDDTKKVIEKTTTSLKTKHKNVSFKTIFKRHNEGKGASLKEGFKISTGEIVIVQDADLEYNPEDYPLLLEPFLRNGADVVFGSRFISDRPHRVLYFWHYQVNVLLTIFSNMLTNLNLTDMEAGYKAFKGDLIRELAPKLESKRFGFEPEIAARISKLNTIKIFEVGISYSGRTYAEGKKIGWKDGLKAFWEIFKFNLLKD